MPTKSIQVRDGVWITIPAGLSAQQEAQLLAELDPVALERECKDIMRQHEAGELLPFEAVLPELLKDSTDNGQAQ